MDVSRLDGEMGLFWQGHTHPCVRMFSVTQDIIGVAYGMWFVELGFFLCCTCNYFLTIDQLIFVTLRWQSASSLLAVQYMAGDGKNDTTTRRQTVRRRRRLRGGVDAANERTIQLSMQYIHSGTQQQCTMLVIVHSNSSSTQCQGRKKSNYNHQLCIMFTPTIATTIHTMAAAAAALQTPSPPRRAAAYRRSYPPRKWAITGKIPPSQSSFFIA